MMTTSCLGFMFGGPISLTEAVISLAAARLPLMAAAVLPIL